MRRIAGTVAAGLMVIGGGLLAAPPAAAYPAGANPAVAMVGANVLAPGGVSSARAVNFQPGCRASMRIIRVKPKASTRPRVRIIQSDGTATFAFAAPKRPGRYLVRVRQLQTPNCEAFSVGTRFEVER